MQKIAVVYHSQYGHTKLLAGNVVAGARMVPETEVFLMDVEEAAKRLEELHAMDAVVFGSPTYMGTLSAGMKKFFETTSQFWRLKKWTNKISGGFTSGSNTSGDKLSTLQNIYLFAMQHGMIWVGTDLLPNTKLPEFEDKPLNKDGIWAGSGAQSTRDQEHPLMEGEAQSAKYYGKRIAETTLQFVKGRS